MLSCFNKSRSTIRHVYFSLKFFYENVLNKRFVEKELISGVEGRQPKFQELWNRVKHGGTGTIVIAELSRLSYGMRILVNFSIIVLIIALW